MTIYKPEEVELVYIDEYGDDHRQLASDVNDRGIYTDPNTGEDMIIDHIVIP